MIDRRALGDVGLAVLLVTPTLALSRPAATIPDIQILKASAPVTVQLAVNERKPLAGRGTLRG
jgi:hypothetical protein